MRLLPFLLDGGRYRFVKTKLIHFRRFKEVDISRTRLSDKERGYQWDRCISYLKGMEWFIVFDIVKITKDGAYTLANLFYTQDIVDLDEKDRMWYDTQYRTLSRMVHSSNRYYWTFLWNLQDSSPPTLLSSTNLTTLTKRIRGCSCIFLRGYYSGEASSSQMIGQDDGSYQKRGIAKWVAWEDEVVLKP